jgi:hypothetical protein
MDAETFDFSASKRVTLPDGSLVIKDSRLARIGVQHYMGSELGMTGDSAKSVKGVYRPAEEVFDPASMDSFNHLPITIEHPPEFVTPQNRGKYAVGQVSNIRRDGDFMIGDIHITDPRGIAALSSKSQISNGYTNKLDFASGTFNGQAYDAIQRMIRGNHIALVAQARCGASCRVSDTSDTTQQKEKVMSTTDSGLTKVMVDGAPVQVNDAAAIVIDRLTKERDAAKADLAKAQDASTTSAKSIADLTAENETLKASQLTDAMLADIVTAIDQSKAIHKDAEIKGTPADMRRSAIGKVYDAKKAVIDAALCGTELKDATADQLKVIAGVLLASAGGDKKSTDSDNGGQGGGFTIQVGDGARTDKVSRDADGKPRVSARQKFVDSMA